MNENSNTLGIYTESIPHLSCPHCDADLDVSEFMLFEDIECPACNTLIKVPARLGDFILIDELGRGAMGCVYLAQDESLGRMVALKVIRKEFGQDPKMLATVQREAKAMAALNHRNIVQVYSFGRANDQPYFVMELLQGERLDEMIQGGKTVPEIRLLEIALDVARGLEAAGAADMTHGDIKPANILMTEEGVAKVVDFGLARFMEPDAEVEVWGTPYYIAPEKARKKGEDSRSDQYSLGGTLYHALTSQPPFDGADPTKVVIASLKEETPLVSDINPNVTERTVQIIRRMMDKNPNRRYPTYASLLSDLNKALKGAKAAEAQRLEEEKLAQQKSERTIPPIVWISLSTLITVCIGIGIVVWRQNVEKKLIASVVYDGPKRELHKPMTAVEVRNLREAARSLRRGNAGAAEGDLQTAAKFIPARHSAMGWYKFFEAGMAFYAQKPERAKALLQEIVNQQDMMFDGGRVPPEDPRVLAGYALGTVSEGQLSKQLKKAQPYYYHLTELARGYRMLVDNGYDPQSQRHFRAYSEVRQKGLDWPYVLQPIAPDMHLSRKPLNVSLTDPTASLTIPIIPSGDKTPGVVEKVIENRVSTLGGSDYTGDTNGFVTNVEDILPN